MSGEDDDTDDEVSEDKLLDVKVLNKIIESGLSISEYRRNGNGKESS